jgi:hypothetical protein
MSCSNVTSSFLLRALKTLTPDKFFSHYVFGLELTFFGTRFEKMDWRGDILVTRAVKEI